LCDTDPHPGRLPVGRRLEHGRLGRAGYSCRRGRNKPRAERDRGRRSRGRALCVGPADRIFLGFRFGQGVGVQPRFGRCRIPLQCSTDRCVVPQRIGRQRLHVFHGRVHTAVHRRSRQRAALISLKSDRNLTVRRTVDFRDERRWPAFAAAHDAAIPVWSPTRVSRKPSTTSTVRRRVGVTSVTPCIRRSTGKNRCRRDPSNTAFAPVCDARPKALLARASGRPQETHIGFRGAIAAFRGGVEGGC